MMSKLGRFMAVVPFAMQMGIAEGLNLSGGRSFAPSLLAQTRLSEKTGLSLQWHKNADGEIQLLAIQRPSLHIRKINPTSGKIQNEKQFLNAQTKTAGPSVVHSTPKGELIVAVARGSEGAVDVYSDMRDFRASAYLSEKIHSFELVSLDNGNLFLLASTDGGATLFKRSGTRMDPVGTIKSQSPVKRAYAFKGNDNDIEIALATEDKKLNLFNYDADVESLETKNSLGLTGETLTVASFNGKLAFASVDGKSIIGAPLLTQQGASVIVPAKSADFSVLREIQISTSKTLSELAIGDARSITDLSQFNLGAKNFFVFTKDRAIVYIQNENEVSILPAPEGGAILQTTEAAQLGDGSAAIAVLGNGPTGGAVISVIALTSRGANLPRTAGN